MFSSVLPRSSTVNCFVTDDKKLMQVFIEVKKHAFEGIVENVFWNVSQQVVVFSARASVEIMVNSVSARPIFMQFILSLKKMEKQRKCGRFLELFCN